MADDLLAAARRALADGDDREALALLLELWRIRPATEIGDAIDRLVARRNEPPFAGSVTRWLAANDALHGASAAVADAAHGPLIAAIADQTMADTHTMLERAVRWHDARVTAVIRTLLEKLPWTGKRSKDGWRDLFSAIAHHPDPRLLDLAERLPPTWTIGADMQRFLTKGLRAAVTGLSPVSWPEAADLVPAQAAAAGPPRTEADLLAAIYEAPEADAPRSVFADWLLERGDVRGEFIALQLRGETGEALLAKNRKRWLGALEPVVGDVQFRRGFPAVATATFRHQRDVDQHGHHPAWATIEELGWTYSQARDDRLAWSRAVTAEMINLRVVRQPSLDHLLAVKRPWRIERIELTLETSTELGRVLGNPLLPNLRELYAVGLRPSWLANLPLPPHLEVLHPLDGNDRENLVTRAEAAQVETLTFVARLYRARYSRGDDGKMSRLDVDLAIDVPSLAIPPKTAIDHVNGALKRLGFRSMSHVDVTLEVAGQRTSIAHLVEQARRVARGIP